MQNKLNEYIICSTYLLFIEYYYLNSVLIETVNKRYNLCYKFNIQHFIVIAFYCRF